MLERTAKWIALNELQKILALMIFAVLGCSAAQAQRSYSVTDEGTLGYGRPGGYVAPVDLNNRGEVVGFYRPSNSYDQSFIGSGSQIRELGAFSVAVARGINDRGQVVGVYSSQDLFSSATASLFLYSNGQARQLMPGNTGYANAINNRSEVTGGFHQGGKGLEHAFIYTIDTGKVQDIGTLPGTDASEGFSINNRGDVVGVSYVSTSNEQHGFLYRDCKMYDLGTTFEPAQINDFGQIVGNILLPGNIQHAVLHSFGRMYDLGTLPGTTSSAATGINNRGQIVGSSGSLTFLYERGRMYNLSALMAPGSGWVLENANFSDSFGQIAINNWGQIAVVGDNGVRDSYGWVETHVLLLTPASRRFSLP